MYTEMNSVTRHEVRRPMVPLPEGSGTKEGSAVAFVGRDRVGGRLRTVNRRYGIIVQVV